jgi:hypothetical protein
VHQLEVAGAVLVVGALLGALSARHRWTGMMAAVVVALLAAGVATVANTEHLNGITPATAGSVRGDSYLTVSRDEINAARWIRAHSAITDIVMTNRHCSTPVAPYTCDSRRYVVAAFSERQVLIEGWTATPMSTDLAPLGRDSIYVNYWKPALLALNDGFIAHPSAAAAAKLSALGVRWVYVDYSRPYAKTLEPFAHLRYHNAGVAVYQLPISR